MKMAMIGSGAAGSVFAAYLRMGGADLTLVDPYKEHMDKIAKDGLEFVIYPDTKYHTTGYKTAYTCDDIGVMDIVMFMTKATHLEQAIQNAKPCIGPNTVLVSLINGLGNDDKLLKYYPASRCMIGSGVIGTFLDGPGKCVSTPSEGIIMNFGAIENNDVTVAAGKYLEKCYIDGGCKAKFHDDIMPSLWKKIIVNCTVNTVCAVTRLKIGEVENDPYGKQLFRQVISECVSIAHAKGVRLSEKEFLDVDFHHIVTNIADYYPSMAQDMLIKKLPTEIDTLNGAISDYGKQFNVPTPTCDVLSTVVRCIQGNYNNQYKEPTN